MKIDVELQKLEDNRVNGVITSEIQSCGVIGRKAPLTVHEFCFNGQTVKIPLHCDTMESVAAFLSENIVGWEFTVENGSILPKYVLSKEVLERSFREDEDLLSRFGVVVGNTEERMDNQKF